MGHEIQVQKKKLKKKHTIKVVKVKVTRKNNHNLNLSTFSQKATKKVHNEANESEYRKALQNAWQLHQY